MMAFRKDQHTNSIRRNDYVFSFAPGSFFTENKRKKKNVMPKKRRIKMEAREQHVTQERLKA